MKDVSIPHQQTTHIVSQTLTQNFHNSHNIMSGRTFSAQQQANFANNSDPEKGICCVFLVSSTTSDGVASRGT